jgi:transposase
LYTYVMKRQRDTTDLTDEQWERLQPLLETPRSKGGRPRQEAMREIVTALLYYVKNGCTWRDLPHDPPPWSNVSDHFRRWKRNGLLEKVHDALREEVREAEGRERTPSAAVLDARSVRTAEKRGSVGASMGARRSRGASAISPSTRRG